MNKYWHLSTFYLQDSVRDYAEKLLEHFPDDKHLSVIRRLIYRFKRMK
jgi:hypothetical protein